MARSVWKGPFVEESLIKKVENERKKEVNICLEPYGKDRLLKKA